MAVSAAGLIGNVTGATGITVSSAGRRHHRSAGVGNVTGTAGAGILLNGGAGGSITVGGLSANAAVGDVKGATDGINASLGGGTISITGVGNVTGTNGVGISANVSAGR